MAIGRGCLLVRRLVDHFLNHTEVSRTLGDLQVAVITSRHHRRSFMTPTDAALGQRTALRIVPLVITIVGGLVGRALLRFRSQRGNPALGTGDDRRSQARRAHDRSTRKPELIRAVVNLQRRGACLRIDRRSAATSTATAACRSSATSCATASRRRCSPISFIRVEFLRSQVGRPRHGNRGGVRVDALEIRMPIRSARDGGSFRRRGGLGVHLGLGGQHRHQRQDGN